ncbi:MAG: tRNA pseudouridine synthase A [Vicingaceae bacterium]
MARWTNFYLVRIEFLGFRYSGWQTQPGVKTVEEMINKTFRFIFKHNHFKVLGCGRTDAKVSADDYAFELFLNESINIPKLIKGLNHNLPFDIRVKTIEEVDAKFNIIQTPKIKEYHYYFSYGGKSHPFNAPHIINYEQALDIQKMQTAAKILEGKHNFKRFVYKPSEHTVFEREIIKAVIEKNTRYLGDHVPETAHVFKVSSKGFLRYQVRIMMASLIQVGDATLSLSDFEEMLINYNGKPSTLSAPSSGLNLHKLTF